MSGKREKLLAALLDYTKDTLAFISTVRAFCETSSKWELHRETEVHMLMDIKDRFDNLDLTISQVFKSEEKGKAFKKYMKEAFSSSVDRQRAELQSELTELLKATLLGLQESRSFLEAVEKLAATSLLIFTENQMLFLPEDVGLDYVQFMVLVAKQVCPLVLDLMMEPGSFFLPKLQNVEVLASQLDKYIRTVGNICDMFDKSCFSDFDLETVGETVVDLSVRLPEEDIQKMLAHVHQLLEIRDDASFRMAFSFQRELGQQFVTEFQERHPRMLTFLTDMEKAAVELDRMNKGARISNVAGSSVGAVGGVLSIVGLALSPFTLGASLPLTVVGVGMGVTSGVNSLVTMGTELGVNAREGKKANDCFQGFMNDIQSLQDCVDKTKSQDLSKLRISIAEVTMEVIGFVSNTVPVGKARDSITDAASALEHLQTEQVAAYAARVFPEEGGTLRNIPRVTLDALDVGQAAARGTAVLGKTARVGFMTLNALFLGFDIGMIFTESRSLAKGSETKVTRFIRARSALWKSVMDEWQKMSEALDKGLPTLEEKKVILQKKFYPKTEMKM